MDLLIINFYLYILRHKHYGHWIFDLTSFQRKPYLRVILTERENKVNRLPRLHQDSKVLSFPDFFFQFNKCSNHWKSVMAKAAKNP